MKALALALVLFALPLAAGAQGLSEADRADLRRIEAWFGSVQSLKARFSQIAPDGGLSEGEFYMRRPGRLRFEYRPPPRQLVVGDGIWFIFHDIELGQISRVPILSTPLSVLVDSTVDLERGRVRAVRVLRQPGATRVTVLDQDKPEEGSLTLVFRDSPIELLYWEVSDARRQITTVALSQVELNPSLPPVLFTFTDPRDRRPDGN